MTKRYKINAAIYSIIIITVFIFLFILYGASGHHNKFTFQDIMIPIYVILCVTLIYLFPLVSIHMNRLKNLIGVLSIITLAVNLILAIKALLEIFYLNSIPSAVFFSLIFVIVYTTSIAILIGEIIKAIKFGLTTVK